MQPVPNVLIALFVLALAVVSAPADGQTLGTAFTYQGEILDGGAPVTGSCDFTFSLWIEPDSVDANDQVGFPILFADDGGDEPSVDVQGGVFTVTIDFDEDVFDGNARWLQIEVRCPGGAGDFTTLAPRQDVRPVPYALALPAMRIQQNGPDLVSGDCPTVVLFHGPNVIGGWHGNTVADGVQGATIAGGGGVRCSSGSVTERPNTITADSATIGGGGDNEASGDSATIGGGEGNKASGFGATVGGGTTNIASGFLASIAGGSINRATDSSASIGGGQFNIASGLGAVVPGGIGNLAGGNYSFAAGRNAKVRENCHPLDCSFGSNDDDGDEGTFVWSDSNIGAFVSTGPNQFLIRASGGVGIGINDPQELLDVGGNVQADGNLRADELIVPNADRGTPIFIIRRIDTADAERFEAVVGGTGFAGYPLHIGRPNGENEVVIPGDLVVEGTFSNPSDRRLKKNISSVHGALDKMLKLRGVTFEYRETEKRRRPSGKRLGMVAQEVESVFPDWVGVAKGGYKTLSLQGFEALTVEALRDLKKQSAADTESVRSTMATRLTERDHRIARLEAENIEQRKRIDRMEAMLKRMSEDRAGGAR